MVYFVLGTVVLVALALAFVFAPMWRQARVVALATALLVVLGTGVVYITFGTPMALTEQAHLRQPGTLEEAVDSLARHLQANPDELEGWMLLGRSRKSQERFTEAEAAFAQAYRLAPENPDVLVEYAEAIILASPGRRVEGEALEMLAAALEANPLQQRALLLMGVHHQQQGRPAEAAEAWEQLLQVIGPEAAPSLRQRIQGVRAEAGLPPLEDAPALAEVEHEGTRMHVRVELNPLLRDRDISDATLFVIARQIDGPNMPVAVHRQPVTGFPVEVTLSDASAMLPQLKLSDLRAVRLDARISLSGDAAPRAGDLEAESSIVTVGDGRRETLVIERVVASRP